MQAGGASAAGGEDGFPAAAHRAERLGERLCDRDPTLPRWLAALSWPAWVGPIVIAGAALAGLASDAIGPAGRINLLAAPLLGVLAWNLLVMASMGAASARQAWRSACRRARPAVPAPSPADHGGPHAGGPRSGRGTWLAHGVNQAVRWRSRTRSDASSAPAGGDWRSRFAADWLSPPAPLPRARPRAPLPQ